NSWAHYICSASGIIRVQVLVGFVSKIHRRVNDASHRDGIWSAIPTVLPTVRSCPAVCAHQNEIGGSCVSYSRDGRLCGVRPGFGGSIVGFVHQAENHSLVGSIISSEPAPQIAEGGDRNLETADNIIIVAGVVVRIENHKAAGGCGV